MKASQFLSRSIAVVMIWSMTLNAFSSETPRVAKGKLTSEYEQRDFVLDEYTMSPLANYMTKEQYDEFREVTPSKNRKTEILEGKILTFNTQDKEGCEAARLEMNLGEEVCHYDSQTPLVSVVVMRPIEDRADFENKINLPKLSQKQKVGLNSLASFGLLGAGAMGLIYALPESVSKWDKSRGFEALASQYSNRVKSGPIMDQDDWAINYIGHPVSGAIYYTVVRHQGYSPLESALFSFCMSTFFWEYGLEAFAEVPSIQDLILTPLIGSILGEVFYSWGNAIEKNGGVLLGSKALGKTVSVLMNPAGAMANKINKMANHKLIQSADLSFVNKSSAPRALNLNNERINTGSSYVGLQLKMKF